VVEDISIGPSGNGQFLYKAFVFNLISYANFGAFTAVVFQVEVFWVVNYPEDGGSIGTLPQHYTASQPRRPGLLFPFLLPTAIDILFS
jgi:hypothetical protein